MRKRGSAGYGEREDQKRQSRPSGLERAWSLSRLKSSILLFGPKTEAGQKPLSVSCSVSSRRFETRRFDHYRFDDETAVRREKAEREFRTL